MSTQNSTKKRQFSQISGGRDQPVQSPEKKRKCEETKDEKPTPIDQVVAKQETTLAALVSANPDFFKRIASSEFKSGELQRLLKTNAIGNKLRSFAA